MVQSEEVWWRVSAASQMTCSALLEALVAIIVNLELLTIFLAGMERLNQVCYCAEKAERGVRDERGQAGGSYGGQGQGRGVHRLGRDRTRA